MLRPKEYLFLVSFCVLLASSVSEEQSPRWPSEGALCPTDQVTNATCSCAENDGETVFTCKTNEEIPSSKFINRLLQFIWISLNLDKAN